MSEDLAGCKALQRHHPFPVRYFGNGKENYLKIILGDSHHQKMEKQIKKEEDKLGCRPDYEFYYQFLIKFFNEAAERLGLSGAEILCGLMY